LRLLDGCIQGTEDLENYIGATQPSAPSQEEEEKQMEEFLIARQGASEATAAARYGDIKLANEYLDSIDFQM
jgi:hypothetical protein